MLGEPPLSAWSPARPRTLCRLTEERGMRPFRLLCSVCGDSMGPGPFNQHQITLPLVAHICYQQLNTSAHTPPCPSAALHFLCGLCLWEVDLSGPASGEHQSPQGWVRASGPPGSKPLCLHSECARLWSRAAAGFCWHQILDTPSSGFLASPTDAQVPMLCHFLARLSLVTC